ncbi:MAG: hypothetical protein PHS92_04090 [Candidatus Gracilibacteria bacterium]|nr:hypothetical protein [Candidatus Gracilibacteria bacterium]
MIKTLDKWEVIIKEKRKRTSFMVFLKEIVSLWPLVLNKKDGIISRYPDSSRIRGTIDDRKFFDEMESTSDSLQCYDFSKDFFGNYKLLLNETYFPNLLHISSENSDYSDVVAWSKNIYLSFVVMESENVLYSYGVKDNSRNILNSVVVNKQSENIYMCSGISKSFNIFYSKYIEDSSDIWFCDNLIGCHDCIFCNDLENKSFFIGNAEFSKADFLKEKENILNQKDKFSDWYDVLNKRGENIGSIGINGNRIMNSTNIENGCFVDGVKNGRNLVMVGGKGLFSDCYDVYDSGTGDDSHDLYGLSGGGMGNNQYNCITSLGSYLYYCNFCWECSFCLGCIGLKNKMYCILNKQYSKDEWFEMADKIFFQMDEAGILGDFFPGDMNPFYFNDTVASILGDFTKEEVIKDGFLWREGKINVDIPENSDVINFTDLNLENLDESILEKVIRDNNGNYYKIVKMEYEFLKKYDLPLPGMHWLDRIRSGFRFE